MTVKLNSTPDELYSLALEDGSLPYTGRELITTTSQESFAEAINILEGIGPVVRSNKLYDDNVDISSLSDSTTAVVFENIGSFLTYPVKQAHHHYQPKCQMFRLKLKLLFLLLMPQSHYR